jgi:hypothetical protein
VKLTWALLPRSRRALILVGLRGVTTPSLIINFRGENVTPVRLTSAAAPPGSTVTFTVPAPIEAAKPSVASVEGSLMP